MKAKRKAARFFEEAYPNIAHFVDAIGYITFGHDDSPLASFIRAIDLDGTVWEGKDTYKTLEEAFQDLEAGLGTWTREEEIK